MRRKWTNTNVAILGYSLSGIAAAKYLAAKGAECTISEKREAKEEDSAGIEELRSLGIEVEMGEHKESTILEADLIVVSPGIPPRSEAIQLAIQNKIPLISEVELAYTQTDKPFIAITGTNGKTTTTKLISEILTNAGYKAPACGNIGVPIIGLIDSNPDYYVAELSSFQLHSSPTFKPQIGLFVNYSPDHIDWHGSEEEYYKTKAELFTTHKNPNWAVLNAAEAPIYRLKDETPSEVELFGLETEGNCTFTKDGTIFNKRNSRVTEIIKISEIPLIGNHNYMNIMAAIAVTSIVGVETEIIRDTIANFKPPEHRLEFVTDIDTTAFYNDSKATNCDSTICALKAFEGRQVVLIAGGKDKGTDLTEFANTVKQYVNEVVLIGQAADRFEAALTANSYNNIHRADSLEQATDIALDLKKGDVLFSPACASFDMFKNFEERGRSFKNYVITKKETLSRA